MSSTYLPEDVLIRRAVDVLFEELGAVEAARSEARVFLDRAAHNLAALPDNTYRRSLLGLCDFVVQRTN